MFNYLRQFSRRIHLWLALVSLIPAVIVISSGILLQVKKQSDWIQPPTQKGQATSPSIDFEHILSIARSIPELGVADWQQIDRLDVRPSKGIIKIRARNSWEAQIDAESGKVLLLAYRRSNTIESIHDGSWFADSAKLWIFLPAAIALLIMWCSGAILLYTTLKSKYKKRRARQHYHKPD
ncbi:PepSY domain-containing protein [Alteromonas sp. a30]|uniref:PepSY domain-containing protein n=1 Tax=Alteromonas sp. a30 TaxID=2730917 RepID=UPI00227EBA51|nr:PepSY domain-containing protein [Alteromonas sp. a30]MCY7296643.1 PepSY domain-containing protein [Alteromonas sp. a30]